jgi:outer membrane protein assembly factor BamB
MQKIFRIFAIVPALLVSACASSPEPVTPSASETPTPASTSAPSVAAPVWTAQLSGAVNAAPFVAGDRVIAATAGGSIHAVHAETGVPAWDFSPAEKVWDASVNGDEARICAGQAGGKLTCLDAQTGQPLWTIDLGLEVQSRIAVTPDRVYAPTTLAGSGLTNDYSGQASLFAVNTATGEIIWEAVTENYILRRPVVNGDVVIVGGAYQVGGQSTGTVASRIYALNTSDGSLRWKYESNDGLVRWVDSDGETAFFSAATEIVYALSLVDGKLLWQYGPGYWMQFPAMQSGRIFFGSGDENFQAHETITGRQIWKHAINMSALNQIGRPLIDGNRIWFNSVTGEIYALNLEDGKQVQYVFTGKTARVGGALFNSFYILGDPEGKLYAFTVQ